MLREGELRKVRVTADDINRDEYELPPGTRVLVQDGAAVEAGDQIARLPKPEEETDDPEARRLRARVDGVIERKRGTRRLAITYFTTETREYDIPAAARLRIAEGQRIEAGDALTEGSINPQDMMRILGVDAVHRYLVTEVQEVYRAQGVTIHDKHIEVIVRQMLRKVQIDESGDSDWLPGELVDRYTYQEVNTRLISDGEASATAQPVLLGVTKASLSQESWLSAASFQETTRVLTEAAINGAVDNLVGLKENVIIGKMIPARAVIELPPLPEPKPLPLSADLSGVEADPFYSADEDDLGELGYGFDEDADTEVDLLPAGVSGFDDDGGYVALPTES